jgi:hypothetical protein
MDRKERDGHTEKETECKTWTEREGWTYGERDKQRLKHAQREREREREID